MTEPTTPKIRSVKLLADLVEKGDAIIPPGGQRPGVVAAIARARKRLVIGLTIELEDGRTFEIGASKFLSQPVASAA